MILRLIVILISTLLAVACTPSLNNNNLQNGDEVSISHLKSLCEGDHYLIVGNLSIRGTIVATDWLGELHKSAIIVDETGGLEFAIESEDICKNLPIFSEVTINCNGLMLARIGGKIELGLPPTGDFPLDNISDEMFDRYIRVVGVNGDFAPETKQFSDIGMEDVGNIVRFDNIRICDQERGATWCDTNEEGEAVTTTRTFIDNEGASFEVRTLATCLYANEDIPVNEITVVGVVNHSDNRYFLRIVNKSIIE